MAALDTPKAAPEKAQLTLAEMVARANLHDDPLRFVLEHIDQQIRRLELVAERDPISPAELAQIHRAAAIGANANVLGMIRAIDARRRWIMLAWWVASVAVAGAAGYLAR